MKTLLAVIGFAVLAVVVVVLLAVLFAYPTMWAINYLFTPSLLLSVFGTPEIGLLQAAVLNFFFGLLGRGTSAVNAGKD
jgi:hypothetical protein